jgi:hypothetical protein
LPRQALSCQKTLGFEHPITKEFMFWFRNSTRYTRLYWKMENVFQGKNYDDLEDQVLQNCYIQFSR